MTSSTTLYPLRFEPIFEYRPWGGRRLADVLAARLPQEGPIGEAWVLSDREDHPSQVSNGWLRGRTLHQLLQQFPAQMMGDFAAEFSRFPLLLKFLDVRTTLSVQVHPSDQQAPLVPAGGTGKTEAWVVLRAGGDSRVYAGLSQGATATTLRQAVTAGEIPGQLEWFTPSPGDTVFIPAGTVHALHDVVVFEVQQNSDVTFRLFDWGNLAAETGLPRALQVDQALACIDFEQAAVRPTVPVIESGDQPAREQLLTSRHFTLWRTRGGSPRPVGATGRPRVLVCLGGIGQLDHRGVRYSLSAGEVCLLPAQIGGATFHPTGDATLLEVAISPGSSSETISS